MLKLKDHQIYLLLWALEAYERMEGTGIAKNHSVPYYVETKAYGGVNPPTRVGIGMATVNGMVTRGYLEQYGDYGTFFRITESGRNILEAHKERISEMKAEAKADSESNKDD